MDILIFYLSLTTTDYALHESPAIYMLKLRLIKLCILKINQFKNPNHKSHKRLCSDQSQQAPCRSDKYQHSLLFPKSMHPIIDKPTLPHPKIRIQALAPAPLPPHQIAETQLRATAPPQNIGETNQHPTLVRGVPRNHSRQAQPVPIKFMPSPHPHNSAPVGYHIRVPPTPEAKRPPQILHHPGFVQANSPIWPAIPVDKPLIFIHHPWCLPRPSQPHNDAHRPSGSFSRNDSMANPIKNLLWPMDANLAQSVELFNYLSLLSRMAVSAQQASLPTGAMIYKQSMNLTHSSPASFKKIRLSQDLSSRWAWLKMRRTCLSQSLLDTCTARYTPDSRKQRLTISTKTPVEAKTLWLGYRGTRRGQKGGGFCQLATMQSQAVIVQTEIN
ncbi:hypothetical protein VP01_400g3 [Puccinia sorghi]|uniref:Uncharacterized protein n=1 Tax=Puccinia sorghi TaxID=27349 RepID=A0A0L6URY7_9BASI|nr:hypothetical protein VP01_400g3 [Puccinia sorghi]